MSEMALAQIRDGKNAEVVSTYGGALAKPYSDHPDYPQKRAP